MKKLADYLNKTNTVLSFLIIECLGLMAFAIGGINQIFYYLGAIICVFAVPFLFKQKLSSKDWISVGLVFVPLFLIAVLISFGNLYSAQSIVSNIGIFLAIPAFFIIGMVARRIKVFKVDVLLITIGVALALLVFISLVYTWIEYGLFYSIIYRDTPVYYYYGSLYNVTAEMGWLFGFSFKEVTLQYSGFFGVMLCSAFAGLLFLSPKKELKKFILTACIGFVGLLLLLTAPNIEALFYLIPIAVIAAAYRFLPHKKGLMSFLGYFLIGIAAVVLIGFFLVYLNAIGVQPLTDWLAGNATLNKVFNTNGFIKPINAVLSQTTSAGNFFGFSPLSASFATREVIFTETNIFEIEIVKEGGILALVFAVILIVTAVLSVIRYSKASKDNKFTKIIIITFLSLFLLYGSFSWPTSPIVHSSGYYSSFFRFLPTLIAIFFLGLVVIPNRTEDAIPEVATDELKQTEVKKDEYVDDYSFDDDDEKQNKPKEEKPSKEESDKPSVPSDDDMDGINV